MRRRPIYKVLYFQVIVAIIIGATLGFVYPDVAVLMKPLGDAFIKLIKMLIAPIIFATVVVGIAKMGDMKEVGRVGLKALVYFEVVSTVALLIGLIVVNVLKPGVGIHANVSSLNTQEVASYATAAQSHTTVEFLMNIIPNSVVDAFAKGEILQVLLFSVLFGWALSHFGEKGRAVVHLIDGIGHVLFGIIGMIMRLAPLGAFDAMVFTVGRYGLGSLLIGAPCVPEIWRRGAVWGFLKPRPLATT